MRRRSSFGRWLALAVALAPAGACSLLGDLSAEQCEAASECAEILGELPQGSEWRCETGVCVQRDTVGCLTNAECAETFENDETFPGPAYCSPSSGECAPLLDDHNCRLVGYDESEDRILIGVLAPRKTSSDPRAFGAVDPVEAAVSRLNDAGIGTQGDKRRVAAIVCGQADDEVVENLRWMHDELGVRLLLTEQASRGVQAMVAEPALEDMVLITTRDNDALLQETLGDHAGQAFSFVAPWENLVPAFALAVTRAEQLAVAQGVAGEVKIAAIVAVGQNDRAVALQQATSQTITPLVEALTDAQQTSGFAQELFNNGYHVIVDLTDVPLVADDLVGNADAFYMAGQAETLPLYVFGPGQRYSDEQLFTAADAIRSTSPLEDRFIGIEHFTDAGLYDSFAADVYPKASDKAAGYNLTFDAVIAVGLAAHLTLVEGGDPADATQIAASLSMLDAGDPREAVTSNDVQDIIGRLSDGQAVQLVGTSGPLDWAGGTSRSMQVSTYCLEAAGSPPSAEYRFGREVLDGMGQLVGTPCW